MNVISNVINSNTLKYVRIDASLPNSSLARIDLLYESYHTMKMFVIAVQNSSICFELWNLFHMANSHTRNRK